MKAATLPFGLCIEMLCRHISANKCHELALQSAFVVMATTPEEWGKAVELFNIAIADYSPQARPTKATPAKVTHKTTGNVVQLFPQTRRRAS